MQSMKNEDFRYMKAVDLAKVFNVDRKTISRWAKDGMPPALEDEKLYDPKEVMEWRCKCAIEKVIKEAEEAEKKRVYEKRQSQKEISGGDSDLDNGEFTDNLDRFRHYKAELAKIEVEKATGALIPRDIVEETICVMGDFCRKSLQEIPKLMGIKLAKERDVVEIEKMLDDQLITVMKGMADVGDDSLR